MVHTLFIRTICGFGKVFTYLVVLLIDLRGIDLFVLEE